MAQTQHVPGGKRGRDGQKNQVLTNNPAPLAEHDPELDNACKMTKSGRLSLKHGAKSLKGRANAPVVDEMVFQVIAETKNAQKLAAEAAEAAEAAQAAEAAEESEELSEAQIEHLEGVFGSMIDEVVAKWGVQSLPVLLSHVAKRLEGAGEAGTASVDA